MAEQRIQIPAGGLGGPKRKRRGVRLTPTIRASLAQRAARRATGGKIASSIAGLLPGPTTTGAATTGLLATGAKAAPGLLRKLGPLAALIVPFVGLEGLRRIQELRGRGDEVRKSLEVLRDPAARSQIIQKRLLRERLQENIIAAKLVRMQNVARNDPGLFKLLSGMVVGSRRPRTTPQTVRIGPEPSQLDLISSGLF